MKPEVHIFLITNVKFFVRLWVEKGIVLFAMLLFTTYLHAVPLSLNMISFDEFTGYDSSRHPSLVPLPQSVQWSNQSCALDKISAIVFSDTSLLKVARDLKTMLSEEGYDIPISTNDENIQAPFIKISLGKISVPQHAEEAYLLTVLSTGLHIQANTAHGAFNGVKTLRQLIGQDGFIQGCSITDWPAFAWRGYMIDVGRNYQSVKQIKEQIDVMARYKLNIFHFHLTENIAWRLQIRQYPELTSSEYMLRNKGQYYTIREMKRLIQYCKDRFITLVPEIDMPGHSDAFTRAMGVDMQSEEGLKIIKNILTEVDSTYEIPYLHIGADEAKFTNKHFIPEVVKLIHAQGKQTVGWAPGGNYDDKTIRQLWQSEGPEEKNNLNNTIQYVDSRDLYLNHMDPLSGVVSIFYRKIGGVEKGNKTMTGGEICLWNDDRAKDEGDILRMNLAYTAMLAFAERSWRGGGYDGFITDMGADTSVRYASFVEFENRLLEQKKRFFQDKPFPYVRQSDIHWNLFGPFSNHGNLSERFWPENRNITLSDSVAALYVNGGTVWLRHFFTPLVSGALKEPLPNTTWYAYRKIYSVTDTTGYFWISFYNPSRSHAVSTSELGQWDKRDSKLWINGQSVAPPLWTYPGRDGSQEDPLVDESYEYRSPTKVHLKKGWNSILVKVPVGSFQGKDWQHPVKWMFTVVRVKQDESK